MPTPAIITPMASPAVQPAATRANPMTPASSTPMGAAPPQQAAAQPQPVGGATQPGLPSAPQQKMAALARAEILSVFIKHGARIEKKKPKDSSVTTGAAVGAGAGGAVGTVAAAHQLAKPAPSKPVVPEAPPTTDLPRGGIESQLDNMIGKAKGLESYAARQSAPAVEAAPTAAPLLARLKQAIKQNGIGRTLARLGPTAGIAAGLGAAGGAAGGLAYRAYRNRQAQRV